MNLTDTDEKIKNYEGFEDSYYSGLKYIALNLPVDFKSEQFRSALAEGFKFMAANPGVYAFHCTEGKDRAGFTAAILECLMGAGYDEVVADYMVTYYNYYGIKPGEARYETYIKENIAGILKEAFIFKKSDRKKDLKTRNLSKCAEKYLKSIGLTSTEIDQLKKNLGSGV